MQNIVVLHSYISTLNLSRTAVTLDIEYFVTIDWFRALKVDQLWIMMSSSGDVGDMFKNLNLSRDVYLSEEEIRRLITWEDRFPSIISGIVSRVNLKKPLLFATKKEAINKFSKEIIDKFTTETPYGFSEEVLNSFKIREFSEDLFEGKLCGIRGDPCMIMRACVDRPSNQSIKGSINLITGETDIHKDACVIWSKPIN